MLGRCSDLKSAYKHFARASDQGYMSIVVVWDPTEERARLL